MPTYKIQGVRLSQLKKCPKNCEKDIQIADATMHEMQHLPANACSARFIDEKSGKTLVCVLSYRAPLENGGNTAEPGQKDEASKALNLRCICFVGYRYQELDTKKTSLLFRVQEPHFSRYQEN
jgi:hypothetical protein